MQSVLPSCACDCSQAELHDVIVIIVTTLGMCSCVHEACYQLTNVIAVLHKLYITIALGCLRKWKIVRDRGYRIKREILVFM